MKNVFPKMVSDTILEITNARNWMIIVGMAVLDDDTYAAMVNLDNMDPVSGCYKGYVNKVRMNATKTEFKENFVIYDEEEWGIIWNFFDKSGIFEMNRIERWVWSRVMGTPMVPKWMYEEADKKRLKIIGMDRPTKINVQPDITEPKVIWNETPKRTEESTTNNNTDNIKTVVHTEENKEVDQVQSTSDQLTKMVDENS